MDAFLGYNQMQIYGPNKEKISFITNQGLYYYRVMPFRPEECKSHILEACKCHVQAIDKQNHRGLRGRHGEKSQGTAALN